MYNINMSLTCVSGYWNVTNKHGNEYNNWFMNTLDIKCPYVFFSNKEGIEIIKEFRKNHPTYYIECNIEDFFTYKYKDKVAIHELHCPSVELNLIWNEKIFLLQKAYELNPFNTDWFKWIDAGMFAYRYNKPPNRSFPNINRLNKLPIDKFIYSSSKPYEESLVTNTNYYHHVSGTFMLHKDFINRFVEIYKNYLDKLLDKNNIWTEQVILTHIYKDAPNLFFKLGDGYCEIALNLYSIDTNDLINKIKVIKSNRDYRIADVINKGGFKWEHSRSELLTNNTYTDTILYKYLTHSEFNDTVNLVLLKEILINQKNDKGYDIPNDNELVIHLRLGDWIDRPETYLKKNYIEFINKYVNTYKNINKITFVTCFSYGNFFESGYWIYTEEKHKQNIIMVGDLFNIIINVYNNYDINVVSNTDIDKDLVYCVYSKYFIQDVGGFSELIQQLRNI